MHGHSRISGTAGHATPRLTPLRTKSKLLDYSNSTVSQYDPPSNFIEILYNFQSIDKYKEAVFWNKANWRSSWRKNSSRSSSEWYVHVSYIFICHCRCHSLVIPTTTPPIQFPTYQTTTNQSNPLDPHLLPLHNNTHLRPLPNIIPLPPYPHQTLLPHLRLPPPRNNPPSRHRSRRLHLSPSLTLHLHPPTTTTIQIPRRHRTRERERCVQNLGFIPTYFREWSWK